MIKELLEGWSELISQEPLETVSVTYDESKLSTGLGYISGRGIVYNATTHDVILNKSKLAQDGGIFNVLNRLTHDCFFEEVNVGIQEFLDLKSPFKSNRTKLVTPIVTFGELLEAGLSKNLTPEEQKTLILTVTKDTLNGKRNLNITLNNFSPVFLDWEATFAGLNELDILTFLTYATRPNFLAFPSDTRQELTYSNVDEILASPNGVFLSRLKYKCVLNDVPVEIKDSNLRQSLEDYIVLFKSKEKSRSPFSSFIPLIRKVLDNTLVELALQRYVYLPYLFPFITSFSKRIDAFKNDVSTLLINAQLGKKTYKSPRGILTSTNITRVIDIPYDFLLDVSGRYRAYYKAKGYSTGGFKLVDYKNLFDLIETQEWLARDGYFRFDRSYTNRASRRKINTHDNLRLSGTFAQLTGHAGQSLINYMINYASDKGKNTINGLNVFSDWLTSESKNTYFNSMKDIKAIQIASLGEMETGLTKTFHEYIDSDSRAAESKQSDWGSVKKMFERWAKDESVNTGKNVSSPFIEKGRQFGENTSRSKTTREAMPSLLHSFCVDVLTENSYAFYFNKTRQDSTFLFNQRTHKHEEGVKNYTVPRCLHVLLLLPVRGMQARWLDEGLLDDEIWNYEKECYEPNTYPLANYKYPCGNTHTKLHERTAVLRSDQSTGNENLELFINTNKTASRKALLKGGSKGYQIPWPYGTGVDSLQKVWEILEEQRKFNQTYAPLITLPCNQLDEDTNAFEGFKGKMPYFTPLFRRLTESVSKSDPRGRKGLFLPITQDSIKKLFHEVLREAEKRYKEKYPQFKNALIAFDADGVPRYDIHSLRVFGVTDLLDQGIPVDVVQMIVGHATMIMTLYYRKMDREKFFNLLKTAKECAGASILHEKALLEAGNADKEDLIALFDIVDDWNLASSNKVDPRPDFSQGGRNQVINGGVCSSFDCASGGIAVKYTKSGLNYTITTVEGGEQRCGNCRYFRTGPRFLQDQILYKNKLALEITQMLTKQRTLQAKANECYDNPDKADSGILAERYERQADKMTPMIAYRVVESKRRQLLIDRSRGLEIDSGKNLPISTHNDSEHTFITEELTMFDACMEVTTQAAVLGIDDVEESLSLHKLENFLAQVTSLAKEVNPFYFIPDDETKRLAILYKLYDAADMVGRPITDEEFNSPLKLFENIGNEAFHKLGNHLATAEASLLNNGH